MSFPSTRIATNAGSDIESEIQLLGSDGNPVNVDPNSMEPIGIAILDKSPEIGTITITRRVPHDQGRITVFINWSSAVELGVGYQFRIEYDFSAESVVQTTPLFGVIYQ